MENVPPEEFLINKGAKSVEDARFVCHRTHKTRSELINMGFDEKDVEDLPAYSGAADTVTTSPEYMARHSYDATDVSQTQTSSKAEEGSPITPRVILSTSSRRSSGFFDLTFRRDWMIFPGIAPT